MLAGGDVIIMAYGCALHLGHRRCAVHNCLIQHDRLSTRLNLFWLRTIIHGFTQLFGPLPVFFGLVDADLQGLLLLNQGQLLLLLCLLIKFRLVRFNRILFLISISY